MEAIEYTFPQNDTIRLRPAKFTSRISSVVSSAHIWSLVCCHRNIVANQRIFNYILSNRQHLYLRAGSQNGRTCVLLEFMGKHFKRKPRRPVPGTRKPLTRPIQPKDIGARVPQQTQEQPTLTDEEMLQQLVNMRDSLKSGPGAVAVTGWFDEQIRSLRAKIELQQGLKPKRGSR